MCKPGWQTLTRCSNGLCDQSLNQHFKSNSQVHEHNTRAVTKNYLQYMCHSTTSQILSYIRNTRWNNIRIPISVSNASCLKHSKNYISEQLVYSWSCLFFIWTCNNFSYCYNSAACNFTVFNMTDNYKAYNSSFLEHM